MREYLLPQGGNFYKANLHAHTTVSDGALSPEQVKDLYLSRGYSIVAFTDHDVMVDHSDLADDRFLPLKGYEMRIDDRAERFCEQKTYHINLIAKDPSVCHQVFFNPNSRFTGHAADYAKNVQCREPVYQYNFSPIFINRLLRAAEAGGFLTVCNHPHWSLLDKEDLFPLSGLFGIEVTNGTCTAVRGSADHGSELFERMLRAGKTELIPISADDNHNAQGTDGDFSDSFIGFTMIKAPALRYADVIRALESGDCYASEGPLFTDLYAEDGELHVSTSPVREILLLCRGRNGHRLHKAGDLLLSGGTFPIKRDWGYFRLEIVDERGRRAYTRAYDAARYGR